MYVILYSTVPFCQVTLAKPFALEAALSVRFFIASSRSSELPPITFLQSCRSDKKIKNAKNGHSIHPTSQSPRKPSVGLQFRSIQIRFLSRQESPMRPLCQAPAQCTFAVWCALPQPSAHGRKPCPTFVRQEHAIAAQTGPAPLKGAPAAGCPWCAMVHQAMIGQ